MPPFRRVLVANRGEIAIRVFRALRELGCESVAVYSEADRAARHVRAADDARLIGPGTPPRATSRSSASSRLPGSRVPRRSIPGYGFLAENAELRARLRDAGLVWIGPPADAIEAMGSKIESRRRMAAAGVPVVPGTTERVTTAAQVVELGDSLGWPIAIKASAGGGGRGLKVVRGPDEAARALASAEREGEAYFADGAVYVERYIDDPRHVEIQVLADRHGAVIHLGERDCTLQRRHQKVVEEAPSPAVDDALRERMGAMAVAAARAVGYVSAGTVECLVDPRGRVLLPRDEHAHPGRAHRHRARDRRRSGASADRDRGRRAACAAPVGRAPARPRVRVPGQRGGRGRGLPAGPGADHALPRAGRAGGARRLGRRGGRRGRRAATTRWSPSCSCGTSTAPRAIARMRRALDEFEVEGVPTLLPLHRLIFAHPAFVAGETCAGLVEGTLAAQLAPAGPAAAPPASTARASRRGGGRRPSSRG